MDFVYSSNQQPVDQNIFQMDCAHQRNSIHSSNGYHPQFYAQNYFQGHSVSCIQEDYISRANYQPEMCLPNMTPPYVDTASASDEISIYSPNLSNEKESASYFGNTQYHTTFVTNCSNIEQCNLPNEPNFSNEKENLYTDSYYVEQQPLTPPMDCSTDYKVFSQFKSELGQENCSSKIAEHSSLPTMSSLCNSNLNKPLSKWKRKQERERLMLPLHVRQKRRQAANARERKRMTSLNEAFGRLRAILPQKNVSSASNHVEEDSSRGPTKELSKMEALQTAQAYIAELSRLLREN